MRTTHHRRHNTSAYMPIGCSASTLTLFTVGVLVLLIITYPIQAISLQLALAIYLGIPIAAVWMIRRHFRKTNRRIASVPPRAAAVLPEVPPRVAPRARPRIASLASEAHASRKQAPVYWDGRRVGWEDANGVIHFDHIVVKQGCSKAN